MISRVMWDADGIHICHSRQPMLDVDIRVLVKNHATDNELDAIAGILLSHVREQIHADRSSTRHG